MAAGPVRRWYLLLKGALIALLAGNTAVYLISGTPSEALDSLAWLVLLISFELEMGHGDWFRQHRGKVMLRGARLLAALALVAAAVGYVRSKEWLDAINVGLWITVVALLELEVRHPDTVMRASRSFAAVATTLYTGLGALILAWLLRGEWFDAYDATLWLAAFATLELDLLAKFRNDGPVT